MGGAEHLTFGYARFDPRTSYHKKHTHPHAEEVFYVLEGTGIGGVDAEERALVKGDTVWVLRGAVHWLYNLFDVACEILICVHGAFACSRGLRDRRIAGVFKFAMAEEAEGGVRS
jgi:quercetin dioxygenase-like cupin family protein